jgi:hypothetical protein
VMGLPAHLFENVNLDGLSFLAHPIRAYKRWARRRRLGPYVTEEDEQLPIRLGADPGAESRLAVPASRPWTG